MLELNQFVAESIEYSEDVKEKMETCCSANLQCDAQKRAELNGVSIEEDIRHCDCENKYRECLVFLCSGGLWRALLLKDGKILFGGSSDY